MKHNLKRLFSIICMVAILCTMTVPAYSVEKEIKLKAPYGCMISSITSDGIDVYWKKPAGAEGYEVWRSYKKYGEFKKVKTIKDGTVGDWVDSKFNHKKTRVYYQIRCYAYNSEGQKVFSDFSKIIKAKKRTEFKLERGRIFLRSGSSRRLAAYYGWGNATKCRWYSSNSNIAKVSSTGKIVGVSTGTCYITCRSNQGSGRCEVVVNRKAASPLTKITSRYKKNSKGVWYNSKAEKDDNALIMLVGDMMCVGPQQTYQGYDTGDYNFNESYSLIKNTIEKADFAIGNLETTLSSSWPYMHEEGYINNKPNCNAPSRYLDAIKYGGFDAVVMANNHSCDAKIAGLKETIEQVDRYKLARTGAFWDKKDDRTMVVNVKGIKIGILSYITPETGYNGKDANWSQNKIDTMLNYFSEDKVKKDIKAAKKKGAEYIIVYMHWGTKNDPSIKPSMSAAAQSLADLGVDYIVGGHSHLVQSYDIIEAKDGKQVPCFYSVGDFQTATDQIVGNRDSVIVRIRLKRDEEGNVKLVQNGYIPCYTYTKYKGNRYVTVAIKSSNDAYKRIVKNIGGKIEPYSK